MVELHDQRQEHSEETTVREAARLDEGPGQRVADPALGIGGGQPGGGRGEVERGLRVRVVAPSERVGEASGHGRRGVERQGIRERIRPGGEVRLDGESRRLERSVRDPIGRKAGGEPRINERPLRDHRTVGDLYRATVGRDEVGAPARLGAAAARRRNRGNAHSRRVGELLGRSHLLEVELGALRGEARGLRPVERPSPADGDDPIRRGAPEPFFEDEYRVEPVRRFAVDDDLDVRVGLRKLLDDPSFAARRATLGSTITSARRAPSPLNCSIAPGPQAIRGAVKNPVMAVGSPTADLPGTAGRLPSPRRRSRPRSSHRGAVARAR